MINSIISIGNSTSIHKRGNAEMHIKRTNLFIVGTILRVHFYLYIHANTLISYNLIKIGFKNLISTKPKISLM